MTIAFKDILLLPLLLLILNCSGEKDNPTTFKSQNEYAQYFNIEQNENEIVLQINEGWNGEAKIFNYKLKERSKLNSKVLNPDEIPFPLERVVCMSTSHISYINAIGKSNTIVAISGSQYISDSSIISGIQAKEIYDIGFESSINYELLLSLRPDVVFTYGISGENNTYIDKIREMGIKVIVLGDYLEEHPLGKLEYLKLFGKLYMEDNFADSVFRASSGKYIEKRNKMLDVDKRPKVLLNAPWKDVWYIPGLKSYMSYLITDAGGDLILAKEGRSNPHNIEEVYIKASEADFWLNPNFYTTLKELSNSNPLFAKLPLITSGKVFNNTKRNTSRGGSDFWERGVIEPDVILDDLIKILHPGKADGGELKYYIRLE